MGACHYYVETDGQVYLVRRGERWALPRWREEIPFEIRPDRRFVVAGQEVLFCIPILDHHPHDWHHKDEIPGLDEVEPLVRQAVHLTLPRVVAEAVITRDDQLLLVMPSRGFNAGRWTLPGGFVAYGESPVASAGREVAEEVGVPCRVGECLGVETFLGRGSCYTWHMFFYRAELESERFRPAPDEIQEVRWFPLEQATHLLRGVMRRKIEELWDRLHSR